LGGGPLILSRPPHAEANAERAEVIYWCVGGDEKTAGSMCSGGRGDGPGGLLVMNGPDLIGPASAQSLEATLKGLFRSESKIIVRRVVGVARHDHAYYVSTEDR